MTHPLSADASGFRSPADLDILERTGSGEIHDLDPHSEQDHYRTDPKTGESSIVQRCPSCGGVERVRAEAAKRGGPR
jgi:hypothetical protein